MEDPTKDPLDGNSRDTLFRKLRVLKYFYTFKELESLLGVPSQVLWRYVTLRTVPEKSTARKLLARISELGLFDKVFTEKLPRFEEPWAYLSHPGVLELTALRAYSEFNELNVDTVLAAPDEYSAALAAPIASTLKATLCLSSIKPGSHNLYHEPITLCNGLLTSVGVPKKCVQRDARILLVSMELNLAALEPLTRISLRADAAIVGVFALIGTEEAKEALGEALSNASIRMLYLINIK